MPCAVVYEPVPIGSARADGARVVKSAASSKLKRLAGDEVKTDAPDAMHLARLLRLDEVVMVRALAHAEEAARDLVRTSESSRQDLKRAGSGLETAAAATGSCTGAKK